MVKKDFFNNSEVRVKAFLEGGHTKPGYYASKEINPKELTSIQVKGDYIKMLRITINTPNFSFIASFPSTNLASPLKDFLEMRRFDINFYEKDDYSADLFRFYISSYN